MIGFYEAEAIDAIESSLLINDSLGERNSKCSFATLDDVKEWDEIVVLTDYNQKIFAGVTEQPTIERRGGMVVRRVSTSGYRKLFDRKLIANSYDNQTSGAIIQDIITNYCEGFTSNNVETGTTLDLVIFNYETPSKALDRISRATGYEWMIDFDKDVHFFVRTATAASKTITNNSNFHKNLKITPDISNLVNRVVVRGGTERSSTQTFEKEADGTETIFPLPVRPVNLALFVNAVSKTFELRIEGQTPTEDFVVSYDDKYVENGTLATLSAGDVFKATYKFDVPIRIRKSNQTSIDALKQYFPETDGVFERVIDDPDINSRAIAIARADEELEAYSNPIVRGSFMCHFDYFDVGQIISINTTEFTGEAVIQSIASIHRGGNQWDHTVQFATVLFDFEDFLRELIQARKISLTDSEFVETLYNFEGGFSMSDEATVATDTNQQSEDLTMADDMYSELNHAGIDYVLGPYYPTGYSDTKRVFLLDSSPLG